MVVSYRLQRGDLAFPGLACEHLVSRLHVEHAPVLRRDEVDLLAIELAHMHAPPLVEQLEIHGVLEQAPSIRDPIAGHPGPEAGVDDILLRVRLEERLAVQIVTRGTIEQEGLLERVHVRGDGLVRGLRPRRS